MDIIFVLQGFAELPKSNGYLIIEANGGLNQQRLSVCSVNVFWSVGLPSWENLCTHPKFGLIFSFLSCLVTA